MKSLVKIEGYQIEFNGRSTYFVVDQHGSCRLATDTLRKAKNYLKRILSNYNHITEQTLKSI